MADSTMPTGCVAAHQRHRDADKAGTADEIHLQAGRRAHDRVERHHAGQRARQQHGDDDDARIGNAGIGAALGLTPRCASRSRAWCARSAPRRKAATKSDDEGNVERRSTELGAEHDHHPVQLRQLPAVEEGAGLGAILPARFSTLHQEIDHQRCGDEVEHDRGDDDMAAALGLQEAGMKRPGAPNSAGADDASGMVTYQGT
jgi:hypothetical protein